jgi:hypothetical protein
VTESNSTKVPEKSEESFQSVEIGVKLSIGEVAREEI